MCSTTPRIVMFMGGCLMCTASYSQADRPPDGALKEQPAVVAPPARKPAGPNAPGSTPSIVTSGSSNFFAPVDPSSHGSARLGFSSGDGSAHAREMADKLANPQMRLILRQEQRESLTRLYPDVGSALKLDAALEERLLDLLTDQQMQRLEERFTSTARPAFEQSLQERAHAHTREVEQLRELLEEQGYERFETYKSTAPERAQVAQFEEQLAPKDRLDEERRARLIDILREEREAQMQRMQMRTRLPPFSRGFPPQSRDPSAMQRSIARSNYRALADNEAASARLLPKLEPILTPQQFAAYRILETERMSAQRRTIEERLEQAGLSATDLEAAEADEAGQSEPVSGRIGFDLTVDVNGTESKFPSVVVGNGNVAEVEVADGLTMELTPTYYEDGWLNVSLKFLEGSGAARRVISHGSSFGQALRYPDGSSSDSARTMTSVNGRKGYVVRIELTKVQQKR